MLLFLASLMILCWLIGTVVENSKSDKVTKQNEFLYSKFVAGKKYNRMVDVFILVSLLHIDLPYMADTLKTGMTAQESLAVVLLIATVATILTIARVVVYLYMGLTILVVASRRPLEVENG